MKKLLANEMLEQIKEGRLVDSRYSGYIFTPAIPDEVFTIVYKSNGDEFKRYLTFDKFIPWIEQVAKNTTNQDADMTEKAIAGTRFYNRCDEAYKSIVKHGDDLTGFTWLDNGNLYSVSIQGKENAERAKTAFTQITEVALPVKLQDFTEENARASEIRRHNEIVKQMGGHDR